jgi:phospholipid transport system substrate-binding protein
VEAHGAEDFAMAHTAALDAKKRGIALRGEILLFKSWVCHLTRNETRLAVTHDVRALARHNDPKALGLFFGLILTATTMLLSLCPIAQGSTTAGDATSLVKGTVGQVLEVLSDKQMSQELRQQKVIEIVAGRFDFTDMARSSLGYNWKKLSLAQQEQFVPLFTSFMEDAYLDKIDSYSGQKVQFVGENAMEANTAEVKSVVQAVDSSDQPIQINYLVKQTEGDWKVYDVTVDEISITANYRNQFTRMIDQQGFDGLMSAMRKKEQELR